MSPACNQWTTALLCSLMIGISGCALSGSKATKPASVTVDKPVAVAASAAKPGAVSAAEKLNGSKQPGGPVTPAAPTTNSVPTQVQRDFDEAMALLKTNRVADAQQLLLQLTRTYPQFAAPWINLGLIEYRGNHFEAAIQYFKQALTRDGQSVIANNYLGMSHRQLGQFKEAEAAYRAALQANPDYPLAHLNLGMLYDLYLQDAAQALDHYERYQALQTQPDAKVASWIKELKGRLSKAAKAPEKSS